MSQTIRALDEDAEFLREQQKPNEQYLWQTLNRLLPDHDGVEIKEEAGFTEKQREEIREIVSEEIAKHARR